MKNKLIIIGANEFQEQLVLKAKNLGYETHAFAWEDGAVAKKDSDYFYPISIVDKEEILQEAKKIKPVGVVSIASDVAVLTVNYLAEELGLTGNSIHSSLISTNKYEMREAFKKNKVPCPEYNLVKDIKEVEVSNFKFPVIVKPVDRSGSRGIFKVESPKNLKDSVKESMSLSFKKQALIEEFADGKEYSMEMVSFNGNHNFLAVTEKFTTGAPNFIETMHLQPAFLDEKVKDEAVNTIKKALDALEIKNGASHSEFKIDKNNKIKIIEIGARMGGDCIGSDLVKLSTGYDFVKMTIDASIGKAPDMNEIMPHRATSLVKFIFNKKDMDMLNNIKENYKDNLFRYEITGEIGSREVKDSSTRFGYFIMEGNSREELLNIINYKGNED